jgi:cytochrome c oxidase subunit III
MSDSHQRYYVPEQSVWPIVGSIALFLVGIGAGFWMNQIAKNQHGSGAYLLIAGLALLFFMLFGWIKNVITESMGGLYKR